MLDETTVGEAERLRAAELKAQQRYYKVVEETDVSEMRVAADAWIRAGDALSDFLAKPAALIAEMTDQASIIR